MKQDGLSDGPGDAWRLRCRSGQAMSHEVPASSDERQADDRPDQCQGQRSADHNEDKSDQHRREASHERHDAGREIPHQDKGREGQFHLPHQKRLSDDELKDAEYEAEDGFKDLPDEADDEGDHWSLLTTTWAPHCSIIGQQRGGDCRPSGGDRVGVLTPVWG